MIYAITRHFGVQFLYDRYKIFNVTELFSNIPPSNTNKPQSNIYHNYIDHAPQTDNPIQPAS